MKKIIKLSVLAISVVTGTQALQAQLVDTSLALGIQSGSVTTNYVINLGLYPGLGAGTTVIGGFNTSTFSAIFGANPVNVGVVGADQSGIVTGDGSSTTVFTTTLRTGIGGDNWWVAGTEAHPTGNITSSGIANMSSYVLGLALGAVSTANINSWNAAIAQSPTSRGSNAGNFGAYVNPMTSYGGGTIVLDLWQANDQNGLNSWTYAGDISMNLSTGLMVYDAPEPSTYAMMSAGGGLGMLSLLRRRKIQLQVS